MWARLTFAYRALLETMWFVPGIIVFASALLAVGMIDASARMGSEALSHYPRLFGASAEGARGMLATIAGSMITVAGVTFSITMVAVTQASAQFSPRILRNFLRDRPSQVTLGGLSGVFTYCLIVLRTIRGGDEGGFVPSIAVLGGFLFACVGIALLIFFIHHISSALQVTRIVAHVAAATDISVRSLFPEIDAEPDLAPAPAIGLEWRSVAASQSGYIMRVDTDMLIDIARQDHLVLRMERGVGAFVVHDTPLVSTSASDGSNGSRSPAAEQVELTARINAAFSIGLYRTLELDPAFGIGQITDIAIKALSPGINDPTTAATCVHYLTSILVGAARRGDLAPWRADADGALRVIAIGPTFDSLLEDAFGGIRRNAEGRAAMHQQLIGALGTIGQVTADGDRRASLLRQLGRVGADAARTVTDPQDRVWLAGLVDEAQRALEMASAPRHGVGIAPLTTASR